MTVTPCSRRRFLARSSAALALGGRGFGAEAAHLRLGLVADAQFADVPAQGTRHYRRSRDRLEAAVADFAALPLAGCVHLGDLIDRDWASFAPMLAVLGRSRHRWHHVLGNHDFEVRDEEKARVPERLGLPARRGAFDLPGWRCLLLDTNDVSRYAHPAGSPGREEAERELARLAAARVRQAKPWNGGVGSAQLRWFEDECAAARRAGRRVLVFSHHPVWPLGDHCAWNAAEILAAVDRQPNVAAWLNGHHHAGALGERHGIPFVTLRGMVETAETTAYAVATLHADRLLLEGRGREPSRELALRPFPTG
jgi:3',5'-cyclic AMP phosphodiesterase CpdA